MLFWCILISFWDITAKTRASGVCITKFSCLPASNVYIKLILRRKPKDCFIFVDHEVVLHD